MSDAKDPKTSAPPKTPLSRTTKLLGLAGQLGRRELTSKFQSMWGDHNPLRKLQTQMDQAATLVQALSQLKGAAMKAGQLLCVEGADFFPPEVLEILRRLQDQATPIDRTSIETVLTEDFGAEWKQLFEHWNPQALAAASIGQVHQATSKGHPLAVKVQYPGIADTIESDVQILRKLISGFLTLTNRQIEIDDLFAELAQVLIQETDYERELNEINEFRRMLSERPEYVVPVVYPELSTKRVLTMSLEQGLRLSEFIALNPPQELREHYGRLLLDLYVIEFFEHGRVQTDPNFGNFLFRPDSRQVVILDYGAVRTYSLEFRQAYQRLLKCIRSESSQAIIEESLQMGLIRPGESSECLECYVTMLKLSVAPFDPSRQPFDFSDLDYSQSVRDAALKFTRQIRHSAPPHQILFLHRKLGGVFNLIKTLGVALDLNPYWRRLVESPPSKG